LLLCLSLFVARTKKTQFLWLLALFYMLSESAEAHFCPMLSEISSTLRMSPDLAGITILAFGNGGPDVFSSIAAIQADNFEILMGAMLGAGCFITHVVVGSVGVIGKSAKVRAFPFVRDVLFYLVGLAFVFVLLWDGMVRLWESVCFLVYYILYVLFATIVHIWNTKRGRAIVVSAKSDEDDKHQHQSPNGAQRQSSETSPLLAPPDVGRPRSSSVHVSEVVPVIAAVPVPQLPPADAPSGSVNRGRSVSQPAAPAVIVAHASTTQKAAATSAAEVEKEDEKEEEAEEPVLVYPSAAASINAEGPVPPLRPVITIAPPKSTKPTKPLTASAAATAAAAVVVPVSDVLRTMPAIGGYGQQQQQWPRRYDSMDRLHYRQMMMLRHGLLRVVQDWRESPLPAIDEGEEAEKPTTLLGRYRAFTEWDEKGWFWKIVFCVMWPFSTAMHLTVPHADVEAYNKWLLAVALSLSPAVGFFAMGQWQYLIAGKIPAVVVAIAITTLFGIAVAVFAPRNGVPRKLQFVIALYSFVVAMMWMYLVAQEAVSLLQSFSVMLSLSPTIVGLTVLSWGNCIGDLVADLTVTRQGYPDMAIAATYAGPLFNMLIGIGIGATLLCARTGTSYPVHISDVMVIDFGYISCALIFSLVFLPLRRFVVDRVLGAVLLGGYLIFITLSFLTEFRIIRIFH